MVLFQAGTRDVMAADTEPPRVWRVYIEGNDSYSDLVIREVIANRSVSFTDRLRFWKKPSSLYSETEVRRDVVRIVRFYQRRGFPDVRVTYSVETPRKDWRRNITFEITEGRPIVIESMSIDFIDFADSEALLEDRLFRRASRSNPLREGRRYEHIKHSEAEGQFTNTLKNLGYAFANTSVNASVDSLNYTAKVAIQLDPGPKAYLGEIRIEGNETVSETLVRKESALETGQPFDQRRLTRAQREIFGHHLFRFVTLHIPEQPRDSTVDLLIRVRENPLRSVNVQGGLGTEELVRGRVTWLHRNPFGNAHSFTASARASFLEQRVNLDYLIPYVFNTSSSYVISPFGQRLNEKNFLLYRAGASNSFVYQYSQSLAGTISYELTINEEILKNRSFVFRDSTQLYNLSSIKITGYYNETLLEQGSGWNIRPYLEISGFFNTGTLNYQRASLDVRRYISFSRSSQLALRSETGVLFADDADKLPSNLLYYLGGTNSVRGWGRWDLGPKRASIDEAGDFEGYIPIGGRYNLAFNVELRQELNRLFRGIGFALFLDGGQIWRTRADVDMADVQFGVGGGLRYRSPVGPIRFDVGYKVNPTDEDLGIYNGENFGGRLARWGFHFSIGNAF